MKMREDHQMIKDDGKREKENEIKKLRNWQSKGKKKLRTTRKALKNVGRSKK